MAICYNASAMAVMFSAGDGEQEAITVANLVEAVDMGNRYGIPVMGVTAVGKQMARDSRYFALASRVCAENGASIVKTYYCDGFEKVAAACPVPVVIAGGKKLPERKHSNPATTPLTTVLPVSIWDVTSSRAKTLPP
ncbi:MAG: hypothetical protein ACLR6J_12245 [Parabacteroides merdae]